MSLQFRLFIIIISIIIGFYFLTPTFQWYFLYNEKDRSEATYNTLQIKNYVEEQRNSALSTLEKNEKLPDYLKFLNNAVSKKYREYDEKEKLKSSYSPGEILTSAREFQEIEQTNFVADAIDDYYSKKIKQKNKTMQGIISLGLDLRGGVYIVARPDMDSLKEQVDIKIQEEVKVKINQQIKKEEKEMTEEEIAAEKQRLTNELTKKYEDQYGEEYAQQAIDQALITLRNRIDKFGVSEAKITKGAEQKRIIIELPGVRDRQRIGEIIETSGKLEFKRVTENSRSIIESLKEEGLRRGENIVNVDGKLKPYYEEKIPAGSELLYVTKQDKYGNEIRDVRDSILVEKEVLIDGSDIIQAQVSQDQLGKPAVSFEFNSGGAARWAKITKDNINKEIAIVLDGNVRSHPVVREQISAGTSQISGGNMAQEEAEVLALILREGSMDVTLEIDEEQTIGATLGADTIAKGMNAFRLGATFVIAFMLVWYLLGGAIADLAVVFNMFFLFALLSSFNFTLTLPGIAGIILTVGMAVDANVIIFERIKEEYRMGKTLQSAVQAGYEKAFWTIMDSNLTTIFGAALLSLFGTGIVKGFAVTLSWGIACSLFTVLIISRFFVELVIRVFHFKNIRFLTFRKV